MDQRIKLLREHQDRVEEIFRDGQLDPAHCATALHGPAGNNNSRIVNVPLRGLPHQPM